MFKWFLRKLLHLKRELKVSNNSANWARWEIVASKERIERCIAVRLHPTNHTFVASKERIESYVLFDGFLVLFVNVASKERIERIVVLKYTPQTALRCI